MRGKRPASNNNRYKHTTDNEQPGIPRAIQRGKECEKHRRCEYRKVEAPKEQPEEHHNKRKYHNATGKSGKAQPLVRDGSPPNGTINRYGTYHGNTTDQYAEYQVPQIAYDRNAIGKHIIYHITNSINKG